MVFALDSRIGYQKQRGIKNESSLYERTTEKTTEEPCHHSEYETESDGETEKAERLYYETLEYLNAENTTKQPRSKTNVSFESALSTSEPALPRLY